MGASTEHTLPQELIIGQTAAIRRVDVTNPEEMKRLRVIENDPERIKWFESLPDKYSPLTDTELEQFAKNDLSHLLYAVSGSTENSNVASSEVGALQGWIQIHPDNQHLEQMREKGIIPPKKDNEEDLGIFEVSYAKLPNAPKGQMASGLRQVAVKLAK